MACDSCGARRGHLGGCLNASDQSLDRRRSKKRQQRPADRGKPPANSKDQLEYVKTDCSKCKGAKVGPFGKRGKIITCPECRGTGTQMREKK